MDVVNENLDNEIYAIEIKGVVSPSHILKKIESEKICTFYAQPTYNAHGEIIAFFELLTKRLIVKRNYYSDEFGDDVEDLYYPYSFEKNYIGPRIGDILVEVMPTYSNEDFQEYINQGTEDINQKLDDLQITTIRETCPGYDETKTMEYYNEKLYLCPLGDDYIVVAPKMSMFGKGNRIIGYYEINTKRKVIEHIDEDIMETEYLLNANKELGSVNIDEVNMLILATRVMTPKEISEYLDLTPEEVEAKISVFLAKLSREKKLSLNK